MKRAYKIEINPTSDQKSKINQTIGISRFIYNFDIAYNKEIYENVNKTSTVKKSRKEVKKRKKENFQENMKV